MKDKIIIFGAGKIGRSFIGQLFSIGGFDVVFADIDLTIINELNSRKKYEVVVKSDEKEEVIMVHNVRAIDARNSELVAKEISEARILAVSVGKRALSSIFPLIAQGIMRRYNNNKYDAIDIIIAENMLDASFYFKKELQNYLTCDFPIDQFVGLIETSIGKMVPIVPKKLAEKDSLRVFAEPYNTLILDKKAFRKSIPVIKGLSPKENIKAWVDRKLFIHNLGHAATAYWGFYNNPLYHYVWEALETPDTFKTVRKTMLQAANLLKKKYPNEFTLTELTDHVDDLLDRFKNKALGDTIFRVGYDLVRKLGPNDRLAGAIKLAIQLNLPYDKILKTLIVACQFRARDENGLMFPGDEIFSKIYRSGIIEVLKKVCGFDESNYTKILEKGQQIENNLHRFDLH